MPDLQRSDIVKIDLSKQLLRSNVGEILAMGDDCANRFGADLVRNGLPVQTDGCIVIGYFIRPDGYTCVIDGVAEGSLAYVDLPEACYIYEGVFSLAIKLKSAEMNCTLRIIDGYLRRTETDIYVDPGEVIPDLADLLFQIDAMEKGTAAAKAATDSANDAAERAGTAADAASSAADAANQAANAINESTVKGYADQAKTSAESAVASAAQAKQIADALGDSASVDQEMIEGSTHAVSGGAVKTYVDAKIEAQESTCVSVSVPASGWTGSAAPYTQTVTVSGILATDNVVIDLIASATAATAETELEAWAMLYRIDTADGSITAYANDKPSVDLTLQILNVK